MPTEIDPEVLETWLEWAAAKLIAMPAGRLKPAEVRAVWPEYSQDKFQIMEFRRNLRIKALAPSADEIPIMDEIVVLPNRCQSKEVRKIVHWRAQIHPVRRTHLLTWNWIANKLELGIYTVKKRHESGLKEILVKTPRPTICRISAFMSQAANSP